MGFSSSVEETVIALAKNSNDADGYVCSALECKLLREKFSHTYQRVWFDTPLLRQPAWQQITLLPKSYQEIHKENIEYMREYSGNEEGFDGFKDFEIQKMLRNLAI